MSKTFCAILKSVCDADPDSFSLYRDYSGRGMYGDTCVGVTCSSALALAGAVLEEIADNYDGEEDFNMHDIAYALGKGRTDSMGRETIVYFPGTRWDGPAEESEDDDDSDQPEDGDHRPSNALEATEFDTNRKD